MKDFFHKNGVLVLIIALLLTLLVGISSVLMGGQADPLSNVATTVTAPVRSLVSSVLDWADGVYNYVFRYDEMNAELEDLRRDCLILDLASRPGGVDLSAAGALGLTVIWALSLPGKVAPVTAGAAIKTTIYNMLHELGY